MPETLTTSQSSVIDSLRKLGPLLTSHGVRPEQMPAAASLDEIVQTAAGETLLGMLVKAGWDLQYAADCLVTVVGDLSRHAAKIEEQVAAGLRADTGWVEQDTRKVVEYTAKRQAAVDQIVQLGYLARKMEESE